MDEEVQKETFTWKQKLNFIIPSLLGVLLLMIPFQINGQSTVLVSVIADWIRETINSIVPIYYLVILVITISFLLGIIYKFFKPKFIEENDLLLEAADVSNFWLLVRFVGLILAFAVAFGQEWGVPELIWGPDTGGLILFDLINGLFIIFLVAGFVLPLLTEFGLLEFIGVFLTRFMRPVFKLPGRSAVNCVASWVGDGTIGVALTAKQYKEGYYTQREAAVVATTFSAVSITFCLVVVQNINMMDKFGIFYLTAAFVGVVCALIVPRIPPLSRKDDTYYTGQQHENAEQGIPNNFSKMEWAMQSAVKQAEHNGDFKQYLTSGAETVASLWLGVIPTIMAIGTIVLIVSYTTPVFTWLGLPFRPLLELMQVPMAAEASETMVIGFADMVVPSIMAADIPNQMTQFIVAAMSIVQLIYMSETGAVILGSNLNVSFIELFIIFIERTLISLPLIVLIAHLIF
ncbi:YjiH family protein [Aerococcus kribbianus]|uniref:YjiH family protein n=1 Tax=Aerococcus kribbianus TaxID=2999064 RepID=A0A9X3FR71_9LACT|nr:MULTISPECIES: YjiH family protein [unclassified Aerococcus]MCZ0718092.1 YjiH family protein [Aerococcus sp. YH-aer221]MCZ0726339.1 YjiH family protein [Aerococcus sp. YH-aer222]